MMLKKKEHSFLLVYYSSGFSYGRVLIPLMPIIALAVSFETRLEILYLISLFLYLILFPYKLLLFTRISFDCDGICVSIPLRKRFSMSWHDVHFVGTNNQTPAGQHQTISYVYFSKMPVNIQKIRNSISLPQLTDDFLFVTIQPELKERLSQFMTDTQFRQAFNNDKPI